MSRVAFVDTIGGAAGDMILGAFLAAGLDLGALTSAIELLQLRGVRLGTERVDRAGVRATKLNVHLAVPAGYRHTHRGRGEGPTLEEIHTRVTLSGLPGPVVNTSVQIFRCLALATAAVESVAVDELRFDSSDIIDTYVDIVGTAHALHSLGIARLYSSLLPVGPGSVQTSHGLMRLPHPVTMEILRMTAAAGRADNESGEQVTPTGAAILSTLADFERPNMRVTARGAGAGTAELDVPNIVRLEIGELENPAPH